MPRDTTGAEEALTHGQRAEEICEVFKKLHHEHGIPDVDVFRRAFLLPAGSRLGPRAGAAMGLFLRNVSAGEDPGNDRVAQDVRSVVQHAERLLASLERQQRDPIAVARDRPWPPPGRSVDPNFKRLDFQPVRSS